MADEATSKFVTPRPGQGSERAVVEDDESPQAGFDHRPAPTESAESLTKEELLAEARDLDIPGRSSMTKEELADAVDAAADTDVDAAPTEAEAAAAAAAQENEKG